MTRLLLDFFLSLPQSLLLSLSACLLLRMRKPALFVVLYNVLFMVNHIVFMYCLDTLGLLWLKATLGLAIHFAFLLTFTAENRRLTFVFALLQQIIFISGELLLNVILGMFMQVNSAQIGFGASDTTFVIMKILYLACFCLLLGIFQYVWRRVITPGKSNRLTLGLVFFPLSQGLLVVQMCMLQVVAGRLTTAAYFALAANVGVCILADILLMREIRRLKRYHTIEQRQLQMEQQIAVQENYYTFLREKMEAVSKLRHDMNNQLQTAFTLLEKRESTLVREQLESLRREVEATSFWRYSANPIVEAVMEDKAARCAELGIALSTQLELPPNLNIEPSDLCSVFSNLLDNSISACTKVQAELRISAAMRSSYLVIETVNSKSASGVTKKDPPREGHGLGLVILKEIADQYGGKLETEDMGDTFTATVWLRARKEAAVCTGR